MSAVKEGREILKLYKKSDACRSEGILTQDFDQNKDKFIPIEYKTPSNKKYSKSGGGVRYIRTSELLDFINKYI